MRELASTQIKAEGRAVRKASLAGFFRDQMAQAQIPKDHWRWKLGKETVYNGSHEAQIAKTFRK